MFPHEIKDIKTTKYSTTKNFSLKYKFGSHEEIHKRNKIEENTKEHSSQSKQPQTKIEQNISFDRHSNQFNVEDHKDELHNKPKSNKSSQIKKQKDNLKINLSILDKRLDYIMNW